jgi:anthranilate synthase component 1
MTPVTRQLTIKKISIKKSPLEIFSKLYNHYENAYILESIEGPTKLSQYSFIGFNPELTITIKNGEAITHNQRTDEKEKEKVEEPLSIITKTLRNRAGFKEQRFVGGAVGYIGYDAVRYWEKLPQKALDDQQFPDVKVGIFDDGIIYDHRKKQAFYYYLNQNRLEEINKRLKDTDNNEALSAKQLKINISKDQFERAVKTAKDYVTAGDVFQVVLSKRYDFQIKGNLIGFYRNLRKINPSPYMYFLKSGAHQIVGSSPEMLAGRPKRTRRTCDVGGPWKK